jgi:Amt family ammonium transporter
VGITANCDAVSANAALIIGLVAGLLVVLGIMFLDKLSIDDPVGAWPVHGLCGIWGGLATGIFVESNSFVTQLIGTAVICAWAFFTMLILFAILKAMGILRVSAEEETRGLDISEHGMHAYPQSQLMEDHVSPVGT